MHPRQNQRHLKPAPAILKRAFTVFCALAGATLIHAQLPPGWTDLDIGGPSQPGSASFANSVWTDSGGGADIWGSADQFNFLYEPTTNDMIVAQATTIQTTDNWAKSGIMFRDSTDPSAMFAMVVITPANGVNLQWRDTDGGQCNYSQVPGIVAPVWVKLVRAGNNFSGYYSTDGTTWVAIGAPVSIPMAPAPLAGFCVTAHNDGLLNTATFANLAISYIAPPPPPPPSTLGVYRLAWTGLNSSLGNTLTALTNTTYNPNWPNNPNTSLTRFYTNFEADVNIGINYYGQRMRAYVVPPEDGNYIFWIASDDSSDLFLSTDETPANVTLIGNVPGWTSSRQWGKYPSQQSVPVALQAGRRYYLEAIMQQGTGGDNLAVRWQLPDGTIEEPLPALSPAGTRLVPYDGVDLAPGIYQQTTNLSAIEGQNGFMFVLVTNHAAVTYQWRRQGINLAGATTPSLTVNNLSIANDNGQSYVCVVTNVMGAVTSAPVVLTVLRDTIPPAVLRAYNNGTNSAVVVYSKPVEAASATNTANYVFTNGLPVLGCMLSNDNVSVFLSTGPLQYGSNYTVVINNVRDRASIPNTIEPNTKVSFTAWPYISQDIGGPPIPSTLTLASNGLNLAASGSDIGGATDQFGFSYQTRTGDFDVKVLLSGVSLSDVWAKAGLMARQTLDPSSQFAAAFATPSMVGCFFESRGIYGSVASMAGSVPANYPFTWLRLKRAGNLFTGYVGYDGQTWVQLGGASIVMPAQIYFGFAVSSRNATQPDVAQFRNVSDVTNAVLGSVTKPNEPLGPCSRRTPLVFSEIMYKPAPRTDGLNLEYVEIYNSNPWYQDISGYQIQSGSMSYTFPAGAILPGGGFIVVAASPASIQAVYGIANVIGPYAGSLKATDTLQLIDNQGAILLSVSYSDMPPWPAGADGTGHSLVLANPTYGEGDPRAWDISDVVGGSPGQAETFHSSPLRNVDINEFLARSAPAGQGYIELYNHANAPVDVSGCILTDDPQTNKFVVPTGAIISAHGFVSYTEAALNFHLDGSGGTIYFKNPDQSRYLDAVRYGAQANGVATGRWPDGASEWYLLSAGTPGTNNAAILLSDIVINELMYHPLSGDDNDQYVELYNRSTNTVNLGGWELADAVKFTFPANTLLAPGGYLVVARDAAQLRSNYTNLDLSNCLGDFTGKLSHQGEHLALTMPDILAQTNAQGAVTTNLIQIAVNELTYQSGGRWGQWSDGGGSSMELIDPNSNNRLAYNWADSDETAKSVWTNIEYTGVLANGGSYNGALINQAQLGLLDVGECLVDNIEVRPGGTTGANIITNGDFESGLSGWTLLGDHVRSSIETATGLGGYQSSQSLHLRASDSVWTLADCAQAYLSQATLGAGQTATMRLKARWLRGWPELLMRLRGNWLEVTGRMPVPANLGTPGLPNSRLVSHAGPAIYEVTHSPALPAANQSVVVTARFHDSLPFAPTLLYRIDTAVNFNPSYVSVPMTDDGSGADAIPGDGIYSATIPGQAAGTNVAFLVQAQDSQGAYTLFPAPLGNNAAAPRECVIGFGDPIPTASFSHHHVFITQNWTNLWAKGGGVSHETYDGTWIDGGGRIVYDWTGRYAGSPYHQYLGSPVGTVGGMHWIMPRDDKVFGTSSLNKQHVPGNGPLDDDTIQREQTSYWMAQQIGLRGSNRRYYVYFVNGNRHAPLMEDSQVPDADVLKEYWPNDNNGILYKNHSWFEGDVAPQSNAYMNFKNMSWCSLGRFTTTINGVPNQYDLLRYRWMWWIRQYGESANDFSQLYALIDAANIPTSSPLYYAAMENQVDTENWLRLSAMEHATGDWDSFFTQNQWNMYNYRPTQGKWTALKWDWNITLGGGTSTWPPDGSQLLNVGSNDPIMGALQNYPAYRRAYFRALQDIANLAMNNTAVNPVLDAKYAVFAANGLTTTSFNGLTVNNPAASGGLESWIGTMHNSILTLLANQGVSNIPFSVGSVTVNNDVALVTGTAPLGVKTLWFNGVEWPVTWTSVTSWSVRVPISTGTNQLSIVGVDLHGQPVAGATKTVTAINNAVIPSPLGQVVINEVMANPVLPGAEYIELYDNSTNITFDLSGWRLPALSYNFPPGSLIAPTNFLILAANRAAFASAYGGLIPVFDTFSGSLSSSGQTLLLMNAAGQLVTGVRYGSAAPWPATTPGVSLQLIDPSQDNWRAGNWAIAGTNNPAPPGPQWQYVTITGAATRPILLVGMHGTAGDVYVDDLKLVAGSVPEAGSNLLQDGDFETPLSGPWNVSTNMTNSVISTTVKHSGNASLHVIATSPGDTISQAIWENTSPIVTNGTYTLSYWYLPSTNGTQLLIRLSGSSPSSGQIYSLQNIAPPPVVTLVGATPGATNSVYTPLPPFPPLWLNELQAENLTGPTNSAGQRAPWIELYNPTTNTVSLDGLYMANDYSNLTAWGFPPGAVMNPGEFKVIFADGQTNLSTSSELHTSFALVPGTGSVALSGLYNGMPQVLDYIDYANVSPNDSYGSFPDGQSFFREEFFFATPGVSNNPVIPSSFIAYNSAGSVYTQDFNSLPDPGMTSVNTANPVTISGITYSLADPFDFAAPTSPSGNSGGLGIAALAGWYGQGTLAAKFGATDGDQTTGGVLSFGLPGNGNRALGLLATSSTGGTAFGARFINETTNTFNTIGVEVTGEIWRQSNLPKTLECFYSIDPTGTAPFPTASTSLLPSLNVSLPTLASAVGGVAVDGTAAVNQTNLAAVSQVISNWPPGAALWLVWQMPDSTGKAQGLAIDNLAFTASVQAPLVPVPLTIVTSTTNLVMAWQSVAGQSYQLEYKDDLNAPAWTALGNPIPGTGSLIQVTNDFSLSAQRFYRLQLLP